ncbi:hypothetical protein E4U54_002192 [Claviceps lovelessii]|nr:hypothetical protein E4U54_002192 [Claviceps lovelessii]
MFKTPLRIWAMINHFVVWVSAIIVTGILSWIIRVEPFGSSYVNRTRILYQECIAVITLALWTVGMFLPLISRYRGHLWPANLIFSYLWLTSFIFSTQDWAGGRCSFVGPVFGRCGQKRAVMVFNFLAFFCLLVNVFVEEALFRARRDETDRGVTKNRPAGAAGTSGVQNGHENPVV